MCADLEHEPRARVTGKVLLEGCGRRAQVVGRHHPPVGGHRTELDEAVAEIEANR
jgi:hypothetical protein